MSSLASRSLPAGRLWMASLLISLASIGAPAHAAGLILKTPDGRTVVLKDDGTWAYQESTATDKPEEYKGPLADLRLERKTERGAHCRLTFSLTNNLPYEITHLIPYFSVYRASGVLHESVSASFQNLRPADRIERSVDFSRITCAEIARVQVVGGDRCDMGDLHKFLEPKGLCLARLRAVPSDAIPFAK
jgi:hypothetical protein